MLRASFTFPALKYDSARRMFVAVSEAGSLGFARGAPQADKDKAKTAAQRIGRAGSGAGLFIAETSSLEGAGIVVHRGCRTGRRGPFRSARCGRSRDRRSLP